MIFRIFELNCNIYCNAAFSDLEKKNNAIHVSVESVNEI